MERVYSLQNSPSLHQFEVFRCTRLFIAHNDPLSVYEFLQLAILGLLGLALHHEKHEQWQQSQHKNYAEESEALLSRCHFIKGHPLL